MNNSSKSQEAAGESFEHGTGEPLDLNSLNKLYGYETVKELLSMSLDEARGLLKDVDEGIVAGESKAVMAAAHQLKGLAATMTIHGMAQLCATLEKEASRYEWDEARKTRAALDQSFACVEKYIKQILAGEV